MFPAEPRTKGPVPGLSPSAQLDTEQNSYSTASVQPPSDCGDSSNTTPQPVPPHSELPPAEVVPYRLPVWSKSKTDAGYAPSAESKLCSVVNLPVVSSLKTTPNPISQSPMPPPWKVTPYRLPTVSRITPASGMQPSEPPVKLYSTVSSPVLATLNMDPRSLVPPEAVVP